MAGGGSTLSVPTLLFLGLDAATANGTNRVALLIECVAGVRGFYDQQQSAFADSLRLRTYPQIKDWLFFPSRRAFLRRQMTT